MRILWLYSVDGVTRMWHGGNLRVLNLSKALLAAGHEVYLVHLPTMSHAEQDRQYLQELKSQRLISDYYEIEYGYPWNLGRLAYWMFLGYPRAVNRLLRNHQRAVHAWLGDVAAEKKIDLILLADRRLLFLACGTPADAPVVIDWVDSSVLYLIRRIQTSWRSHKWSGLARDLRNLLYSCLEERYYGRRSSANLVVSPLDRQCLNVVNQRPDRNVVLQNGVVIENRPAECAKVNGRIIFSGNMDFPPNYEAALWFINNVMPLLTKERPDIQFVVAGARPVPELVAYSSTHVQVLGRVEDMRSEIARSELYVAPMVSGGGFKNKVLEAIAAGTFVVSTSMGVEFLPASMRDRLLVANSANDIANNILSFLRNPRQYDSPLAELQAIARSDFSWERKAEDLVSLVRLDGGSKPGSMAETVGKRG